METELPTQLEKDKALKEILDSLLTANNEHTKLIQDLFFRDVRHRERYGKFKLEINDLRRRLKLVEARSIFRDRDEDSDDS